MYAVQPLYDVRQLECSAFAFAAILNNGKVVTWGQEEDGGDSFLANLFLEIQKKQREQWIEILPLVFCLKCWMYAFVCWLVWAVYSTG